LRRYELADPVLWEIGKIVHEADLADERYDAPEAPGLDVLLRGLSMIRGDEQLLALAEPLFDGLYDYRKRALLTGREPSGESSHPVKWVTRERPKTDRIACPW